MFLNYDTGQSYSRDRAGTRGSIIQRELLIFYSTHHQNLSLFQQLACLYVGLFCLDSSITLASLSSCSLLYADERISTNNKYQFSFPVTTRHLTGIVSFQFYNNPERNPSSMLKRSTPCTEPHRQFGSRAGLRRCVPDVQPSSEFTSLLLHFLCPQVHY